MERLRSLSGLDGHLEVEINDTDPQSPGTQFMEERAHFKHVSATKVKKTWDEVIRRKDSSLGIPEQRHRRALSMNESQKEMFRFGLILNELAEARSNETRAKRSVAEKDSDLQLAAGMYLL